MAPLAVPLVPSRAVEDTAGDAGSGFFKGLTASAEAQTVLNVPLRTKRGGLQEPAGLLAEEGSEPRWPKRGGSERSSLACGV